MSDRDPLAERLVANVERHLAEDEAFERAEREAARAWETMTPGRWLASCARALEDDGRLQSVRRRPQEVGSVVPRQGTSTWVAELGGTEPRVWSVRVVATVRRTGEHVVTLDAPKVDRASAPVRVWLEARDGSVRVMAASKGPAVRVRLDGIRETAVPSTLDRKGSDR